MTSRAEKQPWPPEGATAIRLTDLGDPKPLAAVHPLYGAQGTLVREFDELIDTAAGRRPSPWAQGHRIARQTGQR